MFSIKRAALAGAAALALTLCGAAAAGASTTHVEGTVYLANHGDTDFSGQYWANDNITLHMTTSDVTGSAGNYSYTVTYRDNGTFVTQTPDYVGLSETVAIPQDARGVVNGTGTVTVTGAHALPDQSTLRELAGFPQLGETGVGSLLSQGGTIDTWDYDYHYAIPGTSFTAEQGSGAGQNTP
jgi:hypothetical protein